MMKWIGRFFLLLQLTVLRAEIVEIPVDEEVIIGELSNGLTYYVRPNAYPEKRAELRLVVKVGSIYERDEERGVAHFVEHMVFRGSRHFEDEESIKYLESIGAWSGADTNAATRFESTCYELSIPLEKEGVLEKSLLILSDFAAYATFPKEIVEIERGVILQEMYYRTENARSKMFEKQYNSWTRGSNYENRFPIGVEEVVKTISVEKIRDFYHRWYRPDRMAIVAVGDFDPGKVIDLIEKLFGEIPSSDGEIEEPSLEIDYRSNSGIFINHHPELTETEISLISFYEKDQEGDFAFEDLKSAMVAHLTLDLLQSRLNRLSDQHPALILDGVASQFAFNPLYSCLEIGAALFENRWREGISLLRDEMRRASEFGFTAAEWKKLKIQIIRSLKSELENCETRPHRENVSDCIDHFLEGDKIFNSREILQMSLRIVEEISLDDINKGVKPWDKVEDWTIVFSTPSSAIIDQISPDELLAFLEDNSETDFVPPVEEELPKMAVKRELPDGRIIDYVQDDVFGITYLSLSNGVKAVLKPSQVEKNALYVLGVAENGYASLPEEVYFSARYAIPYLYRSGLGDLHAAQFDDYLDIEGIRFYLTVDRNSRSIFLRCQDEGQEKMFNILHAVFTAPNFDKTVWEGLVDQNLEFVRDRLNNPKIVFEDFTWETNTQGHFLFQPVDPRKVDEEQAQVAFGRLFGNPADFNFIIVGDFKDQEIEKLVIEYLASIPRKDLPPLPSVRFPTLFPPVKSTSALKLSNSSNASVVVSFPCDYEGVRNRFGTNDYILAARVIFEQRLTELLRKEMGSTYHVNVSVINPFFPSYDNAVVRIEFDCLPHDIEKMVEAVFAKIEEMRETLPTEEEVATIRELFRTDKKNDTETNEYWISTIAISEELKIPLKEVVDYESRIEGITPEVIHEVARDYFFSSPYHTILSHVPEYTDS